MMEYCIYLYCIVWGLLYSSKDIKKSYKYAYSCDVGLFEILTIVKNKMK